MNETTTKWIAEIDEINLTLDTHEWLFESEFEATWNVLNQWQMGEYRIREYRSDRHHLSIQVRGPNKETAKALAAAAFVAIDNGEWDPELTTTQLTS